MAYVIKANGERQEFDREKIYQTCLRAGVSPKEARRIAADAEKSAYDGITTNKILKFVLGKLNKIERTHKQRYEIRDSLSKLDGPEFEKYVQHLLISHGYQTQANIILKGQIVEHEIDIIAEKDWKKFFVECKHHVNPHRFTGLQEALETWASFDDLVKGGHNFDTPWLITNTKFSEHAIKYARGKNMWLTSWNYPEKNNLRDWITEKGFYPLTSLGVSPQSREQLGTAGIFLVKELAGANAQEVSAKAKIPLAALNQLVKKARELLNTK